MGVNLESGIKDLENNIDIFNNNISILQPINIKNNKNKKYEDSHEEKEKKLESPCTVLTKKINNKPTRNRKKIIMYNSIQINKSSNSIGNKISTSILPLKNENIPQKTVSIKENDEINDNTDNNQKNKRVINNRIKISSCSSNQMSSERENL